MHMTMETFYFWSILSVVLVAFASPDQASQCKFKPVPNAFEKLYYRRDSFVDKTAMLKPFEKFFRRNTTNHLLVTAPRRFGKTSNMEMVQAFFQNSSHKPSFETKFRDIFSDRKLNISNDNSFFEEHFQKYPVVSLKLYFSINNREEGSTDDKILEGLAEQYMYSIQEYFWLYDDIYKNNPNLESDDYLIKEMFELFLVPDLKKIIAHRQFYQWLKYLGKALYNFYGKTPLLLVDEYDHPVVLSILYGSNGKGTAKHLKELWSSALNSTSTYRAFFTGITGVAGCVGLTELAVIHKQFLGNHEFSKFNGFYNDEMDDLFTKFKVNKEGRQLIKQLYNGYRSYNSLETFYNPQAMANCLLDISKREVVNDYEYTIKSYWTQKDELGHSSSIFQNAVILQHYVTLTTGNDGIFFNYQTELSMKDVLSVSEHTVYNETYDVDIYFSYLVQTGYLSYFKMGSKAMKAPNKEVVRALRQELNRYYKSFHSRKFVLANDITQCLRNITETPIVFPELFKEMKTSMEASFECYFLHKRERDAFFVPKGLDFQIEVFMAVVSNTGNQFFRSFDIQKNVIKLDHTIFDSMSFRYDEVSLSKNALPGNVSLGVADILAVSRDKSTILIMGFKHNVNRKQFDNAINEQLLRYIPEENFYDNCKLSGNISLKYMLVNIKTPKMKPLTPIVKPLVNIKTPKMKLSTPVVKPVRVQVAYINDKLYDTEKKMIVPTSEKLIKKM